MNTEHEDRQLDKLLQQWATKSTSASAGRLANLNDRIVASLTESVEPSVLAKQQHDQTAPTQGHPVFQYRPANQGRWASGFVVGVVVTTLLSAGLVLLQSNRSVVLPVSDGPPEYAWLHKDQLQNKAVLLSEMEALFDRPLTWLAETDDRITFSLTEQSNQSTTVRDEDRLAVRVVVERRTAGSGDWQPAWAMDVVSCSEEMISLNPQGTEGHQLRLWMYRLPDGMVAVDSEFQLPGTESVLAAASELHSNDRPVQVFTSHNNGTEFRVFQSVAVLNRKVI